MKSPLPGLALLPSALMLAATAAERTFEPRRVLEKPVRAITNAPAMSARDAEAGLVMKDELVLGVEQHGQARAYPINQLTGPQREIINDTLGGERIGSCWASCSGTRPKPIALMPSSSNSS